MGYWKVVLVHLFHECNKVADAPAKWLECDWERLIMKTC